MLSTDFLLDGRNQLTYILQSGDLCGTEREREFIFNGTYQVNVSDGIPSIDLLRSQIICRLNFQAFEDLTKNVFEAVSDVFAGHLDGLRED
jgi:hypothetical protein